MENMLSNKDAQDIPFDENMKMSFTKGCLQGGRSIIPFAMEPSYRRTSRHIKRQRILDQDNADDIVIYKTAKFARTLTEFLLQAMKSVEVWCRKLD